MKFEEFGNRWNSLRGIEPFENFADLSSENTKCEKIDTLEKLVLQYDYGIANEYRMMSGWVSPEEYLKRSSQGEGDQLQETISPEIVRHFSRLLNSICRGNDLLPYEAEVEPHVERLYVSTWSRKMQLELLMSFPVIQSDRVLGFVFVDDGHGIFFTEAPVVSRYHGTYRDIVSPDRLPENVLYSDAAFKELMEKATFSREDKFDASDFHTLPHVILNDIKSKIWRCEMNAGRMPESEISLANHNRRILEKQDTFVVDTLNLGRIFVSFHYSESGEIESEVKVLNQKAFLRQKKNL